MLRVRPAYRRVSVRNRLAHLASLWSEWVRTHLVEPTLLL